MYHPKAFVSPKTFNPLKHFKIVKLISLSSSSFPSREENLEFRGGIRAISVSKVSAPSSNFKEQSGSALTLVGLKTRSKEE